MGQIMKARGLNANFVQIPNEILQRKDLSLTAKGLICYLISLPEDWVICKTKLHLQLKEGRDGVMNAFNELIKEGYILQVQKIGERGRFDYDYIVYNKPTKPEIDRNAFSVNGATVTAEPLTVNPLPYKENNNKEIKQTKKEREQPKIFAPKGYERLWEIPVPIELKQAWDTTPLLAEKWEAFCKSRFQSHNVKYASEIQEATAIKLFLKKCGTVGKAIASLDVCISKGYKHPDYYASETTGTKEPKKNHYGFDVSRLG